MTIGSCSMLGTHNCHFSSMSCWTLLCGWRTQGNRLSSRCVYIVAEKRVVMCMSAVEQTGKNTFFGRTATLLQSVENLGNLQKILMRVVVVLLVTLLPPLSS